MKRCTESHTVPSFGEIPEGSLWADDSPYVIDDTKFEDVDETPAPVRKKQPVRKFGAPVEAAVESDDTVE